MKFSTILALALASYTTLATAQQNGDFRAKNADDAEKLTNDFKKLTADSPCQSGQDACVGDQFAQCVNGKFALTSCASGEKCVVLPLVNKPGTSITCDTEADRKARLAEARGQQPGQPQQPQQPPQGKNATNPDNGKTKNVAKGKAKNNTPSAPPQGKNADNGKTKNVAKGKGNNTPQQPSAPPQGKNADNGKTKNVAKGKGNNTPQQPNASPKGKNATTPVSSDPNVFRPQNAADAEKLTNDFKKLTANSSCQDGQDACVGDQFAQCVNGKFELTSCASGTKCVVLPLVNKPGTSIACDTEADRQARLAEARGQQPSQPKRRSSSSQDPNVFRPQNAADAEKLTNDFKKLTANSPCQDGQNACVDDKFAQCVNGKFESTSCASGTKCVVLPLVNKPGTSITCDTEADRQARLAEARGQQPKRRSAEKRRFIKRYRVISKQ